MDPGCVKRASWLFGPGGDLEERGPKAAPGLIKLGEGRGCRRKRIPRIGGWEAMGKRWGEMGGNGVGGGADSSKPNSQKADLSTEMPFVH